MTTLQIPSYEELSAQLTERLGVPVKPEMFLDFEKTIWITTKHRNVVNGLTWYIRADDDRLVSKDRWWVELRMETNTAQRNFHERKWKQSLAYYETAEYARFAEDRFYLTTLREAVQSCISGLLELEPGSHSSDNSVTRRRNQK